MVPAVDVGGDYFDVLPQTDCGWVGIGDVTGHGLLASLVMMMLQSMLASLIQRDPGGSPSEILCRLNAVLFDNVHGRLGRDDYATLCLLRLDTDGRVTHGGAHEEIIVRRARTGRCERLPTTGVWVGATRSVAGLMHDATFVLEPDDVLVLYTDGLTEAMDARHEPFGVERILELVECRPNASAAELCDALIVAGQSFSSLPRDDITVVVARYCSSTSHCPPTHPVPASQTTPQPPQF
jgi:serine phosphatase RsbU (regulator of sigma subunit)